MRKYIHTALIIFALALPCFGQDSGVFSNYFATEEMAKWCHSGRVERCQAAGLAVTEPTFWDYLLGKNHAKLENVKTDIKACIPYYVKPVTNVLAVLTSDGIAGLVFSNEAQFLEYCGLATNALDETPYFKSQYPNVTGGWQNVRVMITNLIVMTNRVDWSPNVWTNRAYSGYLHGDSWSELPASRPVVPLGGATIGDLGNGTLFDILTGYYFQPYYATLYPWDFENTLFRIDGYHPNARGSWTTYSDASTWATNWDLAKYGVTNSFTVGKTGFQTSGVYRAANCGIDWERPFLPYMIKHRPKAVIGGVCDNHITNVFISSTNYAYTALTNEVYVPVETNIVEAGYGTVYLPVTNFYYETNDVFIIETNGVTPSIVPHTATNTISDLYFTYETNQIFTNISCFGTRFIGTVWTNYNVVWNSFNNYSNRTVLSNYTTLGPDVPFLTNVFSHSDITTNEDIWWEGFSTTNMTYSTNYNYSTNFTYSTQTNTIHGYSTNAILKYAFGLTDIRGYPYAGTAPAYIDIDYFWPSNGLYRMSPIYTGFWHRVDIYYNSQIPSNFPPTIPAGDSSPWHGYNSSAPVNWSNYTTRAEYDNFGDGGSPGWVQHSSETNSSEIVFGSVVTPNLPDFSVSTMDSMLSIYEGFHYPGQPSTQEVNLVGYEITDDVALIWWNVTNGFKYK